MGAGSLPVGAMTDAEIVALLSGIEPSEGEIPKPPFMAAVPAGPVIKSGADLEEVDAWVKARGGWTHRVPAHLAAPDGDRMPLFYIVPKGHLTPRGAGPAPALGRPGGGIPAPTFVPTGGSRSPAGPPDAFEPMGGTGGTGYRPGLAGSDLMAFAATTDMPAARAFYEKALGLRLSGQSPIACTFDANGTTLRVVAVEKATIAPYTVLGWTVTDITATITELAERGVDFETIDGIEQDELGVWNAPGGAKVAWFQDPDGNMLSLTQF